MKYDINIEMELQHENFDKILKNFEHVDGLEEILNATLELYDSETFIDLTKNMENYMNQYNKDFLTSNLTAEDLKEKFLILQNASILKKSKIQLLYVPSLWGDTIVFEHFGALTSFYTVLMKMKANEDKISEEKKFLFIEKLMYLLLDFDKDSTFEHADKNFFHSLKKTKWDKNAKKLFKKIYDMHSDAIVYILGGPFSNIYLYNHSGNRFTLMFLSACNAIKHSREQMIEDDVILAFKTFYKLIHADIDQLSI
ncbi:hypothetical protein [Methanobrevibacter curvatus]|uniref:Uncharacterized protein n=1 Tax=Methanobrevibacter curvatus TaxID=49547 RepID=A0A165Z8D9_9EURY|nr:hypothetical protein [Methanobrevibacter curvatus]KZX10384.1 hypothetical protein MBCUR_18080 [Methanobrevibacter curvatus]